MSTRAVLVVFAFAVLSPGCIPVTEPVGDIEKAEPDKNLVGKWTVTSGRGTAEVLKIKSLTVTAPDVEGNPKGLMRVSMMSQEDNRDIPMWFFTTTVGKHTYVNVIVGPPERGEFPTFGEEGAFAKWKKEATKEYYVFRAARDGDKLTLDCGNHDAFVALMKGENIKDTGKALAHFLTPVGWLAKYLDKTGPDKLFDGTNVLVLAREKK